MYYNRNGNTIKVLLFQKLYYNWSRIIIEALAWELHVQQNHWNSFFSDWNNSSEHRGTLQQGLKWKTGWIFKNCSWQHHLPKAPQNSDLSPRPHTLSSSMLYLEYSRLLVGFEVGHPVYSFSRQILGQHWIQWSSFANPHLDFLAFF
jgi:hypothetical protein